MKIHYEDNHVLVAEKPGGITTQGEFDEQLKAYLKEKYNKPGNVFLHPIHRLDKPVSGLVLFARTSKALSRLNQQMREGKIERHYRAEIEGELWGEGEWCFYHKKGEYKAFVDPKSFPGSKTIVTKYIGKGNTVELIPITGRYHQLRAQLGFLSLPICGDQKYGASTSKDAIALSCIGLSFDHPVSGLRTSIRL